MRRVFLVLAALAGANSGLAAQEVEFFAHKGSSDVDVMEDVQGLGLAGRFPLLEWLDVQVSLSRRTGSLESEEEICTQYQPRFGCYVESVSWESSLQEASLVLLPAVVRTDYVRLALGGGISLNKLNTAGRGESGRNLAANKPSGAQRGFIGVADVSLSPGRRAPWALVGGVKLHRAKLDGCVPDDPNIPVVERFCGSYTFKEVRVGVAFRF